MTTTMPKKRSFLRAVLSDACLLFAGVFGSVICVMSAYRFSLQLDLFVLIIALSTLAASAIFHSQKRWRITTSISAYVALAVFFVLKLNEISAGCIVFLNSILILLSRIYSGISLIPLPDKIAIILTRTEMLMYFFGFVSMILALLLAWALIRLKSPFICLVITLPLFATSFIFVNWTPSFIPMLVFLGFLLTTFLTNNIRLGKTKTSSAALLAVPVFTFLILLNILNPQENYERSNLGQKIYNYITSYFQLEAQTDNPIEGATSNITSLPSGLAPSDNPNLLSMRNAKPPTGTNTVFNVRFPYEGIQYLRGASYTDYNNSSWILSQNSEFSYNNLRLQKPKLAQTLQFYFTASGERLPYYFNRFNYSTYFSLYQSADYRYDDGSFIINKTIDSALFEIRDGNNYLRFAYMPYYSINNTLPSSRFTINDDYIAALPTKQALEYYSFNVYSPESIGNVNSFWDNEYVFDSILIEIQKFFYPTDYRLLNTVPTELYDYLNSLLNKNNLLDEKDQIKKIKNIVDFVKNSAEYSTEAPPTPQSEDFVRYFLERSNKGFCVHFASAATMMLRTAGIPARYVTGFVAPLDGSDNWVDVNENQAHAWTEVFIDGAGWVAIDATPGIPGLTVIDTSNPHDESSDTSAQPSTSGTTSEQSNESRQSTSSQSESSETSEAYESSETSSPEVVNSFDDWYIVFIIAIPIIFVVLILVIRRRVIINRRTSLFYGTNTNKAAIAAWQQIERLIPYGIAPLQTVHELALMAAFSKHNLTNEQAKTVVSYATNTSKQVYSSLPMFKKLVFKLFKCLI